MNPPHLGSVAHMTAAASSGRQYSKVTSNSLAPDLNVLVHPALRLSASLERVNPNCHLFSSHFRDPESLSFGMPTKSYFEPHRILCLQRYANAVALHSSQLCYEMPVLARDLRFLG